MMLMLFMFRRMNRMITMFLMVVIFLYIFHFYLLPYLRTAHPIGIVTTSPLVIVNAAAMKVHLIFSISDLIVSNSSRVISPRA
jgi:hypothetical protein